MKDLRRTILDATVELVAEQGVRAVSIREVARRAGVSHQAPYHHFGNLAGILHAIASEGFASQADAIEAAAAAERDPLDALSACGRAYVRFAREHTGQFRVMFQSALVDLAAVPEAERAHGVLVRLSGTARKAGYGKGLDPTTMTQICWSVVHGLAFLLIEDTLARKDAGIDEPAVIDNVLDALQSMLRDSGRATSGAAGRRPRKLRAGR